MYACMYVLYVCTYTLVVKKDATVSLKYPPVLAERITSNMSKSSGGTPAGSGRWLLTVIGGYATSSRY